MKKQLSLFMITIFLLSCGQTTIVNELRVRHDFNGDGIADVLVGANLDEDGGVGAGVAFIFYGSSSLGSSIDASNADVKLIGEDATDRFGISISGAGDFNDDGIDDVLVGADQEDAGGGDAGAAYIFYGSTSLPNLIDASIADIKLIGEDGGDRLGRSVSGAGDVNNDGIDDVIAGAHFDDDGGGSSGVAFIFYGSTAMSASVDASTADVKLIGEDASDRFSYAVSGAGDVNDDGYDDVIVGAHFEDAGGGAAGAAYIFYGSNAMSALVDASTADVKLIGEDTNDVFGQAVSGAGDVNNDGIDDVLVGAYGDDAGGSYAGAAYIFYGSTAMSASVDASVADVKLIGEDGGDYFGASVSGAGDVNNDGIDDVLVGAYQDDAGGSGAGAAYIFYGSTAMSASVDASTADVKLIGEDADDTFGRLAVSGVGDVNNDGIDDILVGAYGEDAGGSKAGAVYIFYGSTAMSASVDASVADVKLIGEDAGDRFGYAISGGF